MENENEQSTRPGRQPLPGFDNTPPRGDERRAPRVDDTFAGAEEEYEEPDRDTNYASGFREEGLEEDDFESLLPAELEDDDAELFDRQARFLRSEAASLQGREGRPDTRGTPRDEEDLSEAELAAGWRGDDRDDWPQDDAPDQDAWDAEEAYTQDSEESGRWPLGLIIVAVLALVLVIAGGYGVVQQRAATAAQLVELQAALATAASPEEVAASREALQEARERSAELARQVDALNQENQRLRDTVADLEAQLPQPASAAVSPPAEAEATASPKQAATQADAPAPATKPAPQPATPTPAAGDWFVNFGSYGQSAMAREWAARLEPAAGEVVVVEGARDGRTFYRVRVVGLADEAAADQVARQLERTWELSKLWVGRE